MREGEKEEERENERGILKSKDMKLMWTDK